MHPEDVAAHEQLARERAKSDMEHGYRNYEKLKENVANFEAESRIKLTDKWGYGKGKDVGKTPARAMVGY